MRLAFTAWSPPSEIRHTRHDPGPQVDTRRGPPSVTSLAQTACMAQDPKSRKTPLSAGYSKGLEVLSQEPVEGHCFLWNMQGLNPPAPLN